MKEIRCEMCEVRIERSENLGLKEQYDLFMRIIWAFPLTSGPRYSFIRLQALVTGRYSLLSLTQPYRTLLTPICQLEKDRYPLPSLTQVIHRVRGD